MKINRSGKDLNEVRHPSYPEGDEEEIPLLAEATDSGASRLCVGANHRLNKAEVRAMVKFLERWLETGSLRPRKEEP